ncbi:MAG: hypothetical protein M3O31_01470 [Acidobacteriota bacterium]|nr:hypothetical protein [Acidobacteriota bacterium]
MNCRSTAMCVLILCAAFAELKAQTTPPATPIRAQQLVEIAGIEHPGLVAIAMHVTKPGTTSNIIIASTLTSSIGKGSDEDDIAVGVTGKPFAEPMPEKSRYEVLVPLRTSTGKRIGSLGVIFPWHSGDDTSRFLPLATAIRNSLQPRVISVEDLLLPVEPMVSIIKPHIFAQQLVDQALAAHPEIIILVIRATPPGQTVPIVVGSNIGRYGSPAGKDDSRIIATGTTGIETDEVKHRFEVEPALRDKHGNILGSLSVVFKYEEGSDTSSMKFVAEQVHAKMTEQLPENAALFKTAKP